jgi:hypothetical protein
MPIESRSLSNKSEAQQAFKNRLRERYGQPRNSTLFDMATGLWLPMHLVTAAHIYPRHWHSKLQTDTSLNDIYDVVNGLLLYKPVEVAFDTSRLCIEVDGKGKMSFFLLDETLRSVRLVDEAIRILGKGNENSVTGGVDLQTTFGDLDGRDLFFPGIERPAKRLLCIHAVASWTQYAGLPSPRFPNCQCSEDGKVENFLSMYGWTAV